MLIANPVYDVVFKYLLDDERVARLMLSTLLGKEVVELTYRATEHRAHVTSEGLKEGHLLVLRLDFEAQVKLPTGEHRLVLIEMQKARSPWDLMRFRRYLGSQYASDANFYTDAGGRRVPLPIVTIYFLGEGLARIGASVVRVNRSCRDAATDELLEPDEFIESLTHESLIVQIPKLQAEPRNELEELLTLFDQAHVLRENRHALLIDEQEVPERYREVVRRLQRAMLEPKVVEEMAIEDEVVAALHDKDRQLEAKDKAIADALVAKHEALAAKEAALAAAAAKDEAIAAKEKELEEARKLIQALEAERTKR